MFVHSTRIVTPDGVKDAVMRIEGGKIIEFLNSSEVDAIDLELGNHTVLPGIIDTHNHGTMGYGLGGPCEDIEKEVRGYLKGLASQGVTSCLPTASVEFFPTIAKVMKTEVDGAMPIGIHSEGPYLSRVGEKGINTGYPDIDMEFVKKMVDDAEGQLKLVAIAPEIPGAKEAIEYFISHGVRCAYAHSDMNYHEALDAFKWGITVTTHTANVMSGIHHRRMGGLGACLLSDEVYNELICDGLHISNEMIELMLRVKNDHLNKVMMVSDSATAAGAPVGTYRMFGFDVHIDERGFCLTDTGRLMGSTVPVIRGIRNLHKNLNMELKDIVRMSSYNPAKVYGAESKGSLEAGKDADFVVVDDDFRVLETYREGKCIYHHEKDTDLYNWTFLEKCKA